MKTRHRFWCPVFFDKTFALMLKVLPRAKNTDASLRYRFFDLEIIIECFFNV